MVAPLLVSQMGWMTRARAARPGDTCQLRSARRSERCEEAETEISAMDEGGSERSLYSQVGLQCHMLTNAIHITAWPCILT